MNLHGVDPLDLWSPVPGATWMNYLDLYVSGLTPDDLPSQPPGGTRDILFHVYGDYAAWEVSVTGLGPGDMNTYRIATATPGSSNSRTLSLPKGNYYDISALWKDSRKDGDQYWYCWEITADGQPNAATYNNYNSARLPGVATSIFGDGYVIDNTGGLLTQHVHMRDKGGGNVAGGLTARLYVYGDGEMEGVQIGFRKADGATPTSNLLVSKWENAFNLAGSVVDFKDPYFISDDPDRFYVYVKDRRRTESVIWGYLTDTAGLPNQPGYLELFRQPDGTYLSTNRIIIADANDAKRDDLLTAGAAVNMQYQMTTRALGGTVKAEYIYDGVGLTSIATVGEDVKTLTVDIARMLDGVGGSWCVDFSRVQADMQAMQERFAQANIKVIWNENVEPPFFEPPPSVATNMTNWVAVTTSAQGVLQTTEAARDVIDASGLGTANIRVIYVPGAVRGQAILGSSPIDPYAGYAFDADSFKNDLAKYHDVCFVAANGKPNQALSIFTPAHEVVHLFGEIGHVADQWNLMYETPSPDNALWGTKRLTPAQVDRIRSKGIKNGKLK
jgi:hypothetical protein